MMQDSASSLTAPDLKAKARQWRQQQAEKGVSVSHSQALEAVARQSGYRDWNTAAARLSNARPFVFAVGQRVAGTYLKQPFEGTVIGVQLLGAGERMQLTVAFDAPVDVVSFESFSAFRHRVVATVDKDGVSASRTSDGVPHMVVTALN